MGDLMFVIYDGVYELDYFMKLYDLIMEVMGLNEEV